ncbi:hypothetical protein FPE01S_01_04410 [Flavihumibacter petaseus NBRC 106054]|uniref:Uncharacterized protein n=2 Tax=Flavihumibacter TaxID=1004301 RepID=A0A0E9MV38_9BACT|nr:hypothetical protein FPE01S_01_04410 [Flavihumibacter petaseus NBRC 106054]
MVMVAAGLFTGCTKDPDSVTDLGRYSSGSYPTSLDDLTSVLGTAYANYRHEYLSGFQLLCKTFAATEHTSNLVYGGQAYWNDIQYNNMNSSNLLAKQTWQGLFTGVKDANAALDRADFYEANYMTSSELQMVNYIRGEAHFLRAYYYFMLECLYGESYISASGGDDKMGVPIFTKVPTTLAETQQPRSSAKQVWDLVKQDLQTAAQLLQGVHWEDRYRGRVTDWAAKALLGKAYVFTQDWGNAKTILKEVIDNSGKTLMPYDKYRMAFNSNVGSNLNNNPNCEFNEESLFEINVDRVAADYGIFGGMPNKNLTTSMGLIWSPSGFNDAGTGSIGMGYANECVHDRNLVRFGYDLPLYALVDNPDFDITKPEDVATGNIKRIPDPEYTVKTKQYRAEKITDPRLYVCALEPYQDTVYFGLPGGAGKRRPVAKCANLPTQEYHGWSYKKYQTLDSRLDDVKQADGANYYLLRMADVYLLYAEACMNSGDDITALEYINKVHRRAYGLPVNSASDVDYKTLSDRTKADASDVNLANQPLRYERWAELFAEGHWWFDVCRWRIGANEAAYYGNLLPDNHPSNWSDERSYSFPIPLEELNANIKMAGQQNPGY